MGNQNNFQYSPAKNNIDNLGNICVPSCPVY